MSSFWKTVGRSFAGKCPKCGKGHLLTAYLKQVDHCSNCGEAFGHIRAEDGPAWLTILVVGHILAPILLMVLPHSSWPEWVHMVLWPTLAFILLIILLPRAKGFFIGMIWRNRAH